MKLNKWHYIIVGVLIIILLGVVFFTSSAKADVFDDFSNETMTGYIVDGEQVAFIENITVFEPEGEELFGIPFTLARLKVVSFDGLNIVDDLWMLGRIGSAESNTFYLSYKKLDEPFDVNAGGVAYDVSRHWLGDDAPPVYVGIHLMESGNLLYTFWGEVKIADGYYLGGDVLLGMESLKNRDFVDFEFWGKHNFEPDGSTFGKIFVINIAGKTSVGGGVGFEF